MLQQVEAFYKLREIFWLGLDPSAYTASERKGQIRKVQKLQCTSMALKAQMTAAYDAATEAMDDGNAKEAATILYKATHQLKENLKSGSYGADEDKEFATLLETTFKISQ
jgi:hypothetical protein